jgi:hypothetical protein
VPATGIYNDEVPALLLEALNTLLGNDGWVCLLVGAKEGDLGLSRILLELQATRTHVQQQG